MSWGMRFTGEYIRVIHLAASIPGKRFLDDLDEDGGESGDIAFKLRSAGGESVSGGGRERAVVVDGGALNRDAQGCRKIGRAGPLGHFKKRG